MTDKEKLEIMDKLKLVEDLLEKESPYTALNILFDITHKLLKECIK